ncbi:hypothetical protein EDB89DRAFT_1999237 [Lactarius sanguifluus]|nr:hypothetical protein EDB89DRAFT_1999237 [Lactarius sanguifluus]
MRVSKPLPLTLEVRNLLFMHLWVAIEAAQTLFLNSMHKLPCTCSSGTLSQPAVPRLFAYTYTLWCRWVSMLADSEEVHVPMVQACVAHACLFPKGLDDTVNVCGQEPGINHRLVVERCDQDKWEAANVCMAAVQPHRHAPSYPVKTCADTLRGCGRRRRRSYHKGRLGHRIGLDTVDERGGCVERLQHTPMHTCTPMRVEERQHTFFEPNSTVHG